MKKKELLVLFLILIVIVFVFFDLVTLQKAFLSGDHREQQYPWAKFYQNEIRQGLLPWWTTGIQCGFPLLAEGQIGAFYPLNFLFFYFLPAKWAYNYIILFQYFLGALIFYLYLRSARLSRSASFFATLVYLFGSTQGGYFYYNYISQKVVIWLPLTLILTDRLRRSGKFRDAIWLGLVFAIQIFGGYLQVAVYSIFYTVLYFLYSWLARKNFRFPVFFFLAGFLGILFSLIQLLPTLELSLRSSRAAAPEAIAYIGSMNPLGLATLFYPSWDGFLKSEFYLGLLGLFFAFFSMTVRGNPRKGFFTLAFFVFILLAMGQFSPLYIGIVKLTHFHSFRTPIKFLFFAALSGAVLAGYGFHYFFLRARANSPRRISGRWPYWGFLSLGTIFLAIPCAGGAILRAAREKLFPALQGYVEHHIFSNPGHPYSLEEYKERLGRFYDGVIGYISLSDRDTLIEWSLLAVSLVFVILLVRTVRAKLFWKWACCAFLFFDLFLYGFTSIKANYEPFDSIDPGARSAIRDFLKADKDLFRVTEVYTDPSETGRYPVFPSTNMIDRLEDIAAYSPLVMKRYSEFLAGWGYTNDSLSARYVQPASVLSHLKELSLLNVKYLLSIKPLEDSRLELVMKEKGVTLYRNKEVRTRAFFIPGKLLLNSFDELNLADARSVPIQTYGQQKLEIRYEARQPGLLVITDMNYPNWIAKVNDRPRTIFNAAGLFRALPLMPGKYRIVMEYRPVLYHRLGILALAVLFASLILIALNKRIRKRSR